MKNSRPISEVTETRVEQTGPGGGDFTYVDIGSIDREAKRIVDPKILPSSKAPSRAKQLLKAGDVLVSMTRPNLNAVALVPPDLDGAIGSTGFHVLRARDAEPGFLFYAVQSNEFIDAMCRKVQGALYPAVRPRDISSFRIPPFSLAAQRAAVAEIEKQFTRLEAGVAALRRVQANLKRYRAAVLKAACEGRLVPPEAELANAENRKFETGGELLARILTERRQNWQGRGGFVEPAGPDTSAPSELPVGWALARLGQLSNVVRGASPRPAGDPRYFGGDVPWITVGPLTADDSPYLKSVPTSLNELGREHSRYVEPQTLLLTNSGATLGVPKITLIGGCINDGVAALLDVSYPLKLYLLYFLRTQTKALRGVNQGAAQPNLNTTIIKDIEVPLPPLAEQTRIVAEVERRLTVVEELEAAFSTTVQRATRLRQSILQKEFARA